MIRVFAPKKVPDILRCRGSVATAALMAAYDAGNLKYEFDRKIYGAKSVKTILKAAQMSKCCYCESRFDHVCAGDVEHFRPKKSVRQDVNSKRMGGYYWLVYDINNLLFSCQKCNQSHKSDLFPLDDNSVRIVSHHGDLSVEVPLIINPRLDDPRNYIDFRDEYPYPIAGNSRGAVTIQCVGLDREPLNEKRRERLATVRALWRLVELKTPYAQEAKVQIRAMCQNSSEFSSAVNSFCRDLTKQTGVRI